MKKTKNIKRNLSFILVALVCSAAILLGSLNFTAFSAYAKEVENNFESEIFSADTSDYNVVRHNIATDTDDFLYYNGNMSTLSNVDDDDNIRISEGYFPDNELSDIPSLTNIIGSDDRQKVSDTTVSPYRQICLITAYFKVYNYQTNNYELRPASGTAFLVGENVLLTAGHMLFCDSSSGDVRYEDGIDNPMFLYFMAIVPGAYLDSNDNGVAPFGYSYVDSCYIQKEYYTSLDLNYDWGICVLGEKIGRQIGYLGMSTALKVSSSETNDIEVIGYPGDKNGDMYISRGTYFDATTNRIKHDADTLSGSSGSPVFLEGTLSVRAIHTSGSKEYNGATRINNFIFNLVISLGKKEEPCEISKNYYEGTTFNVYNCVINVTYNSPENTFMILSEDGITFDKIITELTNEFYSSTTTSEITEFSYNYYKTYDIITGTFSSVTKLHNYTEYARSARYKITDKSQIGSVISTSYGQSGNTWTHGGSISRSIKGTVVYNGEAKNIEVVIPSTGYNYSGSISVGGNTFTLRAGISTVSIVAGKAISCSSDAFFAFAVV